jgi:putative transposase
VQSIIDAQPPMWAESTYEVLFSAKKKTKPSPKGPTADLIGADVEMKQRNPIWGCRQIADQINLVFGTSIE